MNSSRLLAGTEGCTTSISGSVASSVIGAKSLIGKAAGTKVERREAGSARIRWTS
jgi:hypothetical protein